MSASLRAWSSGAARRLWGKTSPSIDPVTRRRPARCRPAILKNEEHLFDQDLAFLRHQLERKTQSLNNSNFDVTEDWLFEFASLHAEYMEKASSNKSSSHEFRSTTDLLHHVLQHPRVICMFGAWGKADSRAEKTEHEGQDDLTQAHLSEAKKAHRLSEETKPAHKFLAKSSSSTDLDNIRRVDEGRDLTSDSAQQFCHASLECASEQKLVKSDRRRVSAPAANKPENEGELVQKLRQRASRKSWQGLSPRSLRLAQAAPDARDNFGRAAEGVDNLAARRRLLEDKLKSCGFNNHAPSGGA